MSVLAPSQIMELSVISAQDLAAVARCLKTYATAWVHPDHKLTTRVDKTGGNNPTWNDKFVFRLDDQSLYDDKSMVVIEIYALHWFKDIHVGTVQALVSDLITPTSGMRFVTLEVLRASGRPQGLLNIAVGLIDSSMRGMPLYTPMLYDQDVQFHQRSMSTKRYPPIIPEPEFRPTRSDSSSMLQSDPSAMMEVQGKKEHKKEGSSKDNSDSICVASKESQATASATDKHGFSDSQIVVYQTPKVVSKLMGLVINKTQVEYGTPMRPKMVGRPVITESELGPSASIVAAQVARERALAGKYGESTVISVDERSVEGLQSRLERWQAHLQPIKPNSIYTKPNEAHDVIGGGLNAKHQKMGMPKKHSRRHGDGGSNGLFSCFSNICGAECSIVCGSGGPKGPKKKR